MTPDDRLRGALDDLERSAPGALPPSPDSEAQLGPHRLAMVGAVIVVTALVVGVGGSALVDALRQTAGSPDLPPPMPSTAASSGDAEVSWPTESRVGDYVLTIDAPRSTWRTDEAIEINATLRYVGPLTETVVSGSGSGPIGIHIVEITGTRRIGFFKHDDCRPHAISRGQPIVQPYEKSGGGPTSGPDAEFYRQFFADPEFHLPPGEWRVTALAEFHPGVGCSLSGEEQIRMEASLILSVERPAPAASDG